MALVQPSYGGGSALLDHTPSTPMTSSPGGGSKLAQMQDVDTRNNDSSYSNYSHSRVDYSAALCRTHPGTTPYLTGYNPHAQPCIERDT
uniref:Uncharacterized protein n=1 Tax=Timema tahoe TaxID=61484 RepID=A0A7R9I9K9_9NEOP|nr:unnamed protein product [Timema tahoe]